MSAIASSTRALPVSSTSPVESVPVVDSRHIVTGFVVQEGQTVMLGGIMSDRRSGTANGVPLLMDLPLLGQAFRNDSNETKGVELIILMTPWLVDPQSPGGVASAAGDSATGASATGTEAPPAARRRFPTAASSPRRAPGEERSVAAFSAAVLTSRSLPRPLQGMPT